MKYQLQQYNPEDLNEQRKIFAETEGEYTQESIALWYQSQSATIEVPVGKQLTLVPDNHPWFIALDKQPILGTNENMKVAPEATEVLGKTPSVDDVLEHAKLQGLREREIAIKQAEEFEKLKREFQLQQS